MLSISTESRFHAIRKYCCFGSVDSGARRHIIINLFYLDEDRTSINNAYLYLLNARIIRFEIELKPHFPDLLSLSEQEANDEEKKISTVDFNFQKGVLSICFEPTSFLTNTRPIGIWPGRKLDA